MADISVKFAQTSGELYVSDSRKGHEAID